jgi:predicted SAM-dependent methyltransferase
MWRHSGVDQAATGRGRGYLSDGAKKIASVMNKRVLHVGCGRPGPLRLHAAFRGAGWTELRLDVDPAVRPDIVASITDMRDVVDNESCDALYASHTLEHLHTHDVPPALAEFRRVLAPDGFALLRSPDLAAIASALLQHGPDHVAYVAPAGPITPLDMLFGHNRSIRKGQSAMAHHTGFTEERIGRLILAAGFAEARTLPLPEFDLWAVAFMPEADVTSIIRELAQHGLRFED